jgi:biopolymer transport protein ExbD
MNDLIPLKQSRNSDDNMIPMINIVFLLLVFFMIAGQISASNDIQLPEANLESPVVEGKINLRLHDDKSLFINGQRISMINLRQALDVFIAEELVVSLQADRRVKAVDLDRVLAVLRNKGVIKVTLFAEKIGQD